MSAWICSDKHINAMVTFAASHDVCVHVPVEVLDGLVPLYVRQNCQKVAIILKAENIRSVDHRYRETNIVSPIRYVPVTGYSAIDIVKACQCYDYQACESPDYEQSVAKKICDAIEAEAVRNVPGYEDAAWGID